MNKLVKYMIVFIVFIVLLVFMYSSGYGFGKLKQVVDFEGLVDVDDKDIISSKVSIDSDHKGQILQLKAAVENIKNSDQKNGCFIKYGGFSDLGSSSISIEYDDVSRKTQFIVKNKGIELTDDSFGVEGVKPCVIAGNKKLVSNFAKSYMINKGNEVISNHFMPVTEISIKFNEGYTVDDGNKIVVNNIGLDINDNFDDGGLMYSPDSEHFCFFPTTEDTINGCNVEESLVKSEGLNIDCLEGNVGGQWNLLTYYDKGELTKC